MPATPLLATIPVLALAAGAAAGVPCGDWAPSAVPVYQGTPVIPQHIAPFAADHAVALGEVTGVGVLLMTWDGATWSFLETGSLGISPADIRGARILAADDIWACGLTIADAHGRPFLAHWDGQSWDATVADVLDNPTPDGGDPLRDAEASDLVVLAPDDIWTVGVADAIGISGGNAGDFIACHWDGSTLEEPVIIPSVFNRFNEITDADAAAPDDAWAVGYGRNLTEPFHALMYHFDGTAWTPQSDWTPLPGQTVFSETLWDVATPAPNDAWAVGDKNVGSGTSASLYLRWDGTSWSEVEGPNIGPLTAITHAGPDDVWVSCGFGEYGGRLAHWDGTTWTEIPSYPFPGATHIGLSRLATGGGCDVWATGYQAIYDGAGGWEVFENIIERLLPPPACPADCTADAAVNVEDLVAVITAWGAEGSPPEDVTNDGIVNVDDLAMVIVEWGPCE